MHLHHDQQPPSPITHYPTNMLTRYNSFVQHTTATHSYYFGCVDGALHRGMLNAYARVDRGKLVPLDVEVETVEGKKSRSRSGSGSGTSAFGRSIVDTYQRLHRSKYGGGNDLNSSNGISSNDGNGAANSTSRPPTLDVTNQLLSNLLIPAVLSALKSGKQVVLTGHSLGGSLALLLALDVLTNHCAPSEADTEVLSTPTTDGSSTDSSTTGGSTNYGSTTAPGEDNRQGTKQKATQDADIVSSQSTSPNHDPHDHCKNNEQHQPQNRRSAVGMGGRRCPVDSIDPRLFDRLHVITFGQPGITSSLSSLSVHVMRNTTNLEPIYIPTYLSTSYLPQM